MSLSLIYWLITLPKIGSGVGNFLFWGGVLGFLGYGLIWIISGCELPWKRIVWIPMVVSFVVGGLLLTFVPTTKEIVAIYGINYTTNNKSLQEIPPKLLEYANIKLDNLINQNQ